MPQRLQQIIALAREMRLDTIYSEELADPRMANVIAQEIPNGKVRVLSPIEGPASKIIKAFCYNRSHK